MTQTGQKRDGRNRKIPVNTEFFHLKYVHIIIKIQKNTNGWLLTCMGSQVRVLYCPPYKNPEIKWFRDFLFAFRPEKFGMSETAIRPNRLYDKNTTVLQKWREKEPSGSLSLLRLYGFQRLSQRVRRCVIIDPFQHSGVAVSKQVCNQMLRYALRRPERCSRVPKLMGRQ